MYYLIGMLTGVLLGSLIRRQSLFVQQRVYPLLLIVIALFYVLFGYVTNVPAILVTELRVAFGFILLALFGFNFMPYLLVVGLAGHAVYDLMHDFVIVNHAVPVWWPAFCASVDMVLGLFVWFVIKQIEQANKKAA